MTTLQIATLFVLFNLFPLLVISMKIDIYSLNSYDEFGDEEEYMDEIIHGHRDKDPDKKKRQDGCLCLNRFKDPHCGSDFKTYDNGCYFMCAQKRNPELHLLSWSECGDFDF